MFEDLMRHIGDAVGNWLYLIAGGLAFAEAAIMVGFVLPGEIALLVVGDSVGFEFGRHFGPPVRRSRVGRFVGESRWSTVDSFLHRHGGKAIFLGRLTALLRALMPSMAGMSGMRYRTFLVWNAAGGLVWGAGCVFLGYAFASALNTVSEYLTWLPLAILGAVAAGYLVIHLRKRRRERDDVRALAPDEVDA